MIKDPNMAKGVFGSVYLGKTGQRASKLCLGTMTFGSQLEERRCHELLDYALDKGIYFLDTANAYNAGRSEEILGKWLKSHREQVVVASKVRYQAGDNPMSVGLSRRTLVQEVENSLRRLKTDYLDILYLHQPDDATDVEVTLKAVDDLISAGKICMLGVSNYAAWQIMKLIGIADRRNYSAPRIVQPLYNIISRGIEQELLPLCDDQNLAVFTYNPLAAGLLTGKHSMAKGILKGGRFDVLPYYQDRYWHSAFFEAIEALKDVAEKAGRSLIGLALQWILDQSAVTGVVLGASSRDQLEQNLSVIGDPLPKDVVEACDIIWKRMKGPIPAYNR